jgi:DNA-directed RNA polymerase specialized sigma24 family protein
VERESVGEPGKLINADRRSAAQQARAVEAHARFEAFFGYAFDRVYRFARGRVDSDLRAQALCRMVLYRALTALDGFGALEAGPHRDPEDFAFWL